MTKTITLTKEELLVVLRWASNDVSSDLEWGEYTDENIALSDKLYNLCEQQEDAVIKTLERGVSLSGYLDNVRATLISKILE